MIKRRVNRPRGPESSYVLLVAAIGLVAACAPQATSPEDEAPVTRSPEISQAHHHDASPPLMLLPPVPRSTRLIEHEVKKLPKHFNGTQPAAVDPVRQSRLTSILAIPTTSLDFDGVGNGFSGPAGTFTVNSAPPDTNGDVGPNHYVQIVNTDFAIFNKSGTAVFGPVPINTLWSGFGGGCQTNNDGDPVAIYDPIADRWILSQFSVTTTPYLQCIAVSQTPDPTGAYFRYSFQYSNFPDYPKMGVWPDAYYETFNTFNAAGTAFLGGLVCAYDRTSMLSGAAATQQCFNVGTNFGGLLPSDLDGARQPPAGSPNYVLALGPNVSDTVLELWKFHVDWATPANTTLTGPTAITVAPYTEACSGGTCIPQAGTTQQVDSLADRLMFRLAYRNFGDHETLVANHSVTAGSSTGVRWYEIRSPGGTPTVFQQGTYAPDSNYRWMGSIAIDQGGNIALGFSLSGSGLHPEIHYTGRLAGDALGQMTQGEGSIIDGPGSQTGGLTRWGDYSMMAVDPADDCTFWYTTEYIPSNGSFNWKTRIGSFKFPGCGVPANDFSIGASPTSLSIQQGTSGTSTISTAVTSGTAGTVNLTASVSPSGPTASLNPASVTAGGSSTLTVSVGAAVAPGTYTVTVTGTEGSATHSTAVGVTVTAAPSDFSITAAPTSISVAQGGSGTSTISTAVTSGAAGTVNLTATVSPAGPTASLNPTSVTAGGSSTLTVSAASTVATGSYTVTVTGVEGTATHSATVSVTVTAPPDFSIGASPASLSIQLGSSGTSTISTTAVGSGGTVSLSAGVSPAGPTASLNPTSVAAGGNSTLTVNVASSVATGSYTVTVTGTEGSATHSTTVAVTVTAAPSGIINGGFETGNFSGWTTSGVTSIVSTSHSGSFAAQVGDINPGGDSSISQTFTAPSTATQLSFWYQVHCPDTVQFDWASATLKDNTANTTVTVLGNTCTNTGAWVQATAAVTAGHSYTLTLSNHDDAYPTDPTYTWYDDVALNSVTPSDFTVAASPSSLTVQAGSSGTVTVSTTTAAGSPETVSLAASGLPSGVTASFNPPSVTSGNSSTLTLTASTGATVGTAAVTITGTAASGGPHSATVSLTITAPPPPDFTVSVSPASTSIAQGSSGNVTVNVGAVNASESVSLAASGQPTGVTASFNPASFNSGGSSTLTLTVASSAAAGTSSITITGTAASGGPHSATLTLTVTAPVTGGIVNGGFETGNLTGWTPSGTTSVVSSGAHSGTYAAQIGGTSPTNGDSKIVQTFTAPTGTSHITVWYQVHCPDTVRYDWATITLKNLSSGSTATLLGRTCTNDGTWHSVTGNVTAGTRYTLTLLSHDDNYPGDPTYTLYDDVTLQ